MSDLIYIIGSGRSGSTVIERVLNTSDRAVGIGEIHALWRLPVDSLLCSCGKPVPDCPFWTDVFASSGIGPTELARLATLENEVVRNKYLVRLRFDLDRIAADPRLAEFIALQKSLFDAIRKVSGSDVIIDSSKAGPRAYVLAAGFDPVFLHVYRAAEDVIASWRRPKFEPSTNAPMKKPPMREAAMDWLKVEQSARSLKARSQLARLDYPVFSKDPRRALSEALDPSFPGLIDTVDWKDDNVVRPSSNYHSVLGNPDRFSHDDIVIKPRHATDRSTFPPVEKAVIRVIGRTLGAIYP